MLDSTKIMVTVKNHKDGAMDKISNMVRFYVRYNEYTALESAHKATIEALEKAHQGIDALTVDEKVVRDFFGEKAADDAETFLAARDEMVEIRDDMAAIPVKYNDFTALPVVDRVFITLQAHTALRRVNLDSTLLANFDVKSVVGDYYAKGSMKGEKDKLRAAFQATVGGEGDLFYGVKLKKSDLDDYDVRQFLATFGGRAARAKTKSGYGTYDWVQGWNSDRKALEAATTLFAVILDRGRDWTVIKPEAPKAGGITLDEETPAEAPKAEKTEAAA